MSTTGEQGPLLTIQEAADVLRVSVKTLRRWDAKGTLRAVRLGDSRLMRYRRDDLHTFVSRTP